MKKKAFIALVALAVVGVVGFLVYKWMGQRRVDTEKLTAPFAAAPAEVQAQVKQAAALIKSADYLASLQVLKAVVDKGGLSQGQKDGIGGTASDISGMELGTNAEAVTEMILEIQTKLME